ncbi:MAG: ATP-binding protein [bacterium]|nr:ATP-binding protein [bacterium]
MSLQIVLPLLSGTFIVLLGTIVLLRGSSDRVNRVFFAFAFSVTFWVLSVLLSDNSTTEMMALFWARSAIVGPIFIPAIFLYFSLVFPKDKLSSNPWLSALIFAPSLLLLPLVPTSYNVESVSLETWGVDFAPGALYLIFLVYLIAYIIATAIVLFRNYKVSNETEKIQIIYVAFGWVVAIAIGLISNLLLPLLGETRGSVLGPSIAIIPWVGLTTYAILKHHLFDIKVIATEIFTTLLLLVLAINVLNFDTTAQLIFNIGILIGAAIIGIFLIRSVIWEVRMRKELQKAYEELKRLDKAKSEFVSIASHQLRTPLTAIKGYISMIREGVYKNNPQKQDQAMESVYASNERLIRLVNDLLSLSRLESGKIEIQREEVSIEKLVQDTLNEISIKAKEKGIELRIEMPEEKLPSFFADGPKVRNALLNIIDNAIRYTEKGSVIVRILPIYQGNKIDKVQIQIQDTGEGMDQEELQGLFESFRRGKTGQQTWTEGAGLGLYIAKRFLELQGGRVWAESPGKGKGSTFTIELPLSHV